MLKGKYQKEIPKETYKFLPRDEYVQLKSYVCEFLQDLAVPVYEKTFHRWNIQKSHFSSTLTNGHLRSLLMIENIKFESSMCEFSITAITIYYNAVA